MGTKSSKNSNKGIKNSKSKQNLGTENNDKIENNSLKIERKTPKDPLNENENIKNEIVNEENLDVSQEFKEGEEEIEFNPPNQSFNHEDLDQFDMSLNRHQSKSQIKQKTNSRILNDQDLIRSQRTDTLKKSRLLKSEIYDRDTIHRCLKLGDDGQVELKTIIFSVHYDPKLKAFKVENSFHDLITSVLFWKFKDKLSKYCFGITDLTVQDLRANDIAKIEPFIAKFYSNDQGEFCLEEDGSSSNQESEIFIELEKIWNSIFGFFPITAEKIQGETESNYKECLSFYSEEKLSRKKEIKEWRNSVENLEDFVADLEIEKLVLDDYYKWESPEENNVDATRMKVKSASAITTFNSIAEKSTLRPHICISETSKQIILDFQTSYYIDLTLELRLNILIWDDIRDLITETLVYKEILDFQLYAKARFSEFVKTALAKYRFPLMKNPK